MNHQNVILVVVGGFHGLILQYKFVHDGFNDHGIFEDQHRADQIISSTREIFIRPKMGWVFEPRFTGVNHLHQFLDGNSSIKQPFAGVQGQYNWQIETCAEHGINVARRHYFSDGSANVAYTRRSSLWMSV
jgi:hypothetical protein